ncbi:headcase protein [Toxorhynchites rutilus septentrionalis]|uniref:headcase protein n=1 Tax=Toxorhynchites rutilus septentrionalis TaxID=329112 RepID=UPI00247AA3C6|nr:headcase protein [Toxorhynchites rutilus septentrionalis]XP_055617687.1 headcase protein [Toxorhynchites rutilus septentrionalis]
MAPRRGTLGPVTATPSTLDLFGTLGDSDHGFESSHSADGSGSEGANMTRCCVPTGDCLKCSPVDFGAINLEDLRDCVRVICNNENCTSGQYMHRECFEHWEEGVLNYLKSIGRARSWSDKQRQQNLWTKKGYDLVFKACTCRCARGHLRKDLDWIPPSSLFSSRLDEESNKKKKKKNRQNQKPTLAISTSIGSHSSSSSNSPNSHIAATATAVTGVTHQSMLAHPLKLADHFANTTSLILNAAAGCRGDTNGGMLVTTPHSNGRQRTNSLSSSSNGSSTPPASSIGSTSGGGSGSECQSISPVHCGGGVGGPGGASVAATAAALAKMPLTPKTKVEIYSERVRATSGANGIFSRRLDFSSFNMLPRQRVNSYSIKIEDEGNHGNDETRLFILSSLAAQHKSRVACVLCEEPMLVFDRYPLVDGTFFLSPKQHAKGCIEVKYENRVQYLTSVCMACLDGVVQSRVVRCRFCAQKWDGSSLVLGTMYSYDIFAAMPCCTERLKCNNCFKLLLHPHQRLNFYSDYSHSVSCPYCHAQDTHFVKPLAYCYTKQPMQLFQQWP